MVEIVGAENASLVFSCGVHILSTGNSDFVQNYYINPVLNIALTSEQFSNFLVQKYAQFIEVICLLKLKVVTPALFKKEKHK